MRITMLVGLWMLCIQAFAARVDTVMVRSDVMDKNVKVVVVTPEKTGRFPVVYLLHGYGGNACTWISMVPELVGLAEHDGMIFVCPDGDNSWYMDSPLKPEVRYETFMVEELVTYIDNNYPTVADRRARAITGLSMGGYGAMFLSMRHTELYGAAGSTSGGLDIRPFPRNWGLQRLLGDIAVHKKVWDDYTPLNLIDRLENRRLALIVDCGYDDFFFNVNNKFHEKLLENKIEHDYYVRPGSHNSIYWRNSIFYHMLFFKSYFNRK